MTEPSGFTLASPLSPADFEQYFALRWRILRAPWDQPRGSEKDEREAESEHVMAIGSNREVLGVGRLQLNSPIEAQLRYMAVAESAQGGGLGRALLGELERRARDAGAARIVLNARVDVQGFYAKHGYVVTGPAPTLFGVVKHVRMSKELVL